MIMMKSDTNIKTGRPVLRSYTVSGLPEFSLSLYTSINASKKNAGDEIQSYLGDAAVTLLMGKISDRNEFLLKITKEILTLI